MGPTHIQIAESFTGHKFDEVYDYLADTVTWDNLGGEFLNGKIAVVEACKQSAAYLSDVTTDFKKFATIAGDKHVIIESLADYTTPDDKTSKVASCDVFTFKNGKIVSISSYNVEIE